MRTVGLRGVGLTAIAAAAAAGGGAVAPSNRQTTIEFANPTSYTATGGTFGIRRSVEFPFTGGRVLKYSAGSIPATGPVFCVGVANHADPVTVQGSGFVPVTWNGQPDPVTGGVWSGTTGPTDVEMALSDPFVLSSIPRADGGSGYIVEGREYCANGVATIYNTASAVPGVVVQLRTAGGPAYSGFAKSGNFVTANQAGMTGPGVTAHFIFHDLILFSDASIFTVGAGGDSITRGQFATDGRSNDVRLACDALTLAGIANVSFSSCSRPGGGSWLYAPYSVEYINTVRPGIFFYTPSTPNDGGMNFPFAVNSANTGLAAVKAACDAVGTKLVVCTTVPWAPHSDVADLALRAFNATLQTWATENGCQFYDRYTPTTNGATPASLQVPYQYPTGDANYRAHPNDACYQALAPAAQTIIRGLIGR